MNPFDDLTITRGFPKTVVTNILEYDPRSAFFKINPRLKSISDIITKYEKSGILLYMNEQTNMEKQIEEKYNQLIKDLKSLNITNIKEASIASNKVQEIETIRQIIIDTYRESIYKKYGIIINTYNELKQINNDNDNILSNELKKYICLCNIFALKNDWTSVYRMFILVDHPYFQILCCYMAHRFQNSIENSLIEAMDIDNCIDYFYDKPDNTLVKADCIFYFCKILYDLNINNYRDYASGIFTSIMSNDLFILSIGYLNENFMKELYNWHISEDNPDTHIPYGIELDNLKGRIFEKINTVNNITNNHNINFDMSRYYTQVLLNTTGAILKREIPSIKDISHTNINIFNWIYDYFVSAISNPKYDDNNPTHKMLLYNGYGKVYIYMMECYSAVITNEMIIYISKFYNDININNHPIPYNCLNPVYIYMMDHKFEIDKLNDIQLYAYNLRSTLKS